MTHHKTKKVSAMMMNRTPKLKAGVALSVLCTALAQAQTVPNIGDALRQVPAPSSMPAAQAPLPQVGGAQFEPPMAQLPAGGASVMVKGFGCAGNREIDTATLQAELTSDAGKAYTLAELEALASRLTRFYRAKGYFVARVYVPEQEVKDGVLTLRAVEGNYGQFILDNKSLVRSDIVQGMLDDVTKYDIVSRLYRRRRCAHVHPLGRRFG